MKRKIVVGALALLLCPSFSMPATANPITAPACKDIPSCGIAGVVIGTEIIGGVLYYVVKNAAGVVHRIRASHLPNLRTTEGNGSKPYPVGQIVAVRNPVTTQQECNREARRFTEAGLGEWEALPIEPVSGGSPPTDDLGRIGVPQFTPLYICKVRRVR